MTVLSICSSLSKDIGGPARSVQGLAAGLQAIGVESWLIALKPLGDPWIDGIRHYECLGRNSFLGVKAAVEEAISRIHPDVVHIQSIWMLNMHRSASACRSLGVPYVYSIRGALNPWAYRQHSLKKRLALLTYQGYDFKNAKALHVTSDEEENAVRALCPNAEIFKCPNGVNVPTSLPKWDLHSDGFHKVLFLSRIHESKGLRELVKAWSMIPSGIRRTWRLEIVGNDDNGLWPELCEMARKLGVDGSVEYTGFVDDAAKWIKYRSADCFVLPSYSENFGIAIAEALYAGVPVVVTRATPWCAVEENRCGWWVDLEVSAIANALEVMMKKTDAERQDMGMRGARLIKSKYTWDAVARQMNMLYHQVCER